MSIISDIIKDISKSIIKDIIGIDSASSGSSVYYVISNGVSVFSNGEQVISTPAGLSVDNLTIISGGSLLLVSGGVLLLVE